MKYYLKKKTHKDPKVRIELVNKLSKAIGHRGLAGGQSLDLQFENKKKSIFKILQMYNMKTSSLFSFSCFSPIILAKKNKFNLKFASEYGQLFGLLFQITDDIIDEEEDFKSLGKTPGKDKQQGKRTLLSISSKKNIKNFCKKEAENFIKKHEKIFKKNKILLDLIYFNIDRLN